MKTTKILAILLTTFGLAVYVLWTSDSPELEPEKELQANNYIQINAVERQQNGIETSVASPGILRQKIRAPAKISIANDRLAHILPKSSGIALKAYKNLGEQVEEEGVLAVIESKEMAEAKASFLRALKKSQLTASSLDREKKLHEKKLSPDQDFYLAINAWEEALIELELAQQNLHTLGLTDKEVEQLYSTDIQNLRKYEARSPISGQIISRHITPGEFVSTNQEIYTVADLSKVWAEISIFSQDREYAKPGQTVSIKTHDGEKTFAKVIFLSPIIDEDTRTSTAIAEIDNSNQIWLPGSFVQAELITNEVPVEILIPKEAVQNVDGKLIVFIDTKDGFLTREIITGKHDDYNYEIVSGLNSGEVYANKNTFLLKADLKKDEAEHMD